MNNECICGESMRLVSTSIKEPIVLRHYECNKCGWETSTWSLATEEDCWRMVYVQGQYRQCYNKAKVHNKNEWLDALLCRYHANKIRS